MAFDGYFISKMIAEITPQIINHRIDRISSNDDIISIKLGRNYLTFTTSQTAGLFYLSTENIKHKETEFSSSLRRNLTNFKLTQIKQLGKDRIVMFNFEGIDLIKGPVQKTLILEAFGRNFNLILIEDDLIVSAYKLIHNLEGKTILPNLEYEPFLSNKKILNYNEIKGLSPDEIKDNYQGISPLLARFLVSSPLDLDLAPITPTKNNSNNQFYWFNLFGDSDITQYETLSSLLQDLKVLKTVNKKPYSRFLKTEIAKAKRKLINLEDDLLKHQENLKLKEIADQIYASGLDLSQHSSHFNGTQINIDLTLNENAQRFYNLYKKAKASFEHIENEIYLTKNKIEELIDLESTLEYLLEDDLHEFALILATYGFKYKTSRRHQQNQVNIMKIDFKGTSIYVGKNSNQNEYIFTKIAKNDDLWLHVKSGTGAHVIVKGKTSPEIIEKAAQYAAFYSSYKHSSNIPVDYTLVRYVTKVRKSKTFKTTYINYKTIYINEVSQDILTDH